jgi:hypothetical protein
VLIRGFVLFLYGIVPTFLSSHPTSMEYRLPTCYKKLPNTIICVSEGL